MSDEDKNVNNQEEDQEQESTQTTPAEAKKTDEHMIPKSRLDEEIQKRKDLEKRLSAIEKAGREAETKRLKEQEDYKALYEKAESELTEYKPKAEKVETLETVLKETLDNAIKEIPEDSRSLIPSELPIDAQLRWISVNRQILAKVPPVEQGAGRRGGGETKNVQLTPEEQQIARDWGVSDEEYAKYKDKE